MESRLDQIELNLHRPERKSNVSKENLFSYTHKEKVEIKTIKKSIATYRQVPVVMIQKRYTFIKII